MNENKRYWKSTLTGCVYEQPADFQPESCFLDWVEVTKSEYIDFMACTGWLK